jgi:hypothetical protein
MNDTFELTVVVTSRNDNHGGSLLKRMQLFVNGLAAQCKQYELRTELIVVEWNPPPDKPRLAKVLSWPDNPEPCTIRIIEVPPVIHNQFKYADRLPLFQMIAKNVGIRRAHGRFILATNVDILFSDELIRFLASGRLRKGCMYRVDRYDVPEDIPQNAAIEAQLDYCRQHVIRIYARDGIRSLHTGHYVPGFPKLTWRGWLREKSQDWGLIPVTGPHPLHIYACGDFTLMDREHWFHLRGYPEFEMYSFNLDSVLCYAALHNGAKEIVLPEPMIIYHIEHKIGSGWSPEGEQKLNARLGAVNVPHLSNEQLSALAIQMRRERKPLIFNDENWGLKDLPEITSQRVSKLLR